VPAFQIAALIHEGFDSFYAEFMRLTRAARGLFDAARWPALHAQSQARIDLYLTYVSKTLDAIAPLTERYPQDRALWRQAHVHFAEVVADRPDVEVAETFFNAITRKIFDTQGVNPDIEFLDSDESRYRRREVRGQLRRLEYDADLPRLFEDILRLPQPALAWRDARADAHWLAERFVEYCAALGDECQFDHIDVARPLFFREREGYIVGRVIRGDRTAPLVIPVQPTPSGFVVDELLLRRGDVGQVFSSTRPYFFVDLRRPKDVVDFLGSFLPELTRSELYISIAHHRHGKSVIYRELVEHLRGTDDPFIIAPGIRGLVMTVFTSASYRNVFKIIRDEPDKPGVGREDVLRSYRDVFRGQRAGRLADTQEFEHLAFDRARFDPACLQELVDKAPSVVRVRGDQVVIDHVYIEEKMEPLNLHMERVGVSEACHAIVDYGAAIKELAHHDVFAGDLLWKNFGVTRHRQLVLYDYDEIQPLLQCVFRRVPAARSWEDEMEAAPWFSVREHDVFPEQWGPFVVPSDPPEVREAFLHAHADLLDPDYWCGVQEDLRRGRVRVRLPYSPRHPELQRS
jgi:isocitrate dehydrogenase kinase/phosphatase